MNYRVEGITHVVEADPLDLRVSVEDKPANKILLPNMVTPGFITWEKDLTSPTKRRAVPVSILASEGKIICNRQPHIGYGGYRYPAGTLIVYRNGSVTVKSITDLNYEKDVWFAVGGCSILPKIKMREEGFCIRKSIDGKVRDFSDIGRTTTRPVIGYNPQKNKIIITVRPNSNIARGRQTLINLGCTMGVTLDGGGSTVLRVNGIRKFNTTRQLFSVIAW